MGAGMWSETSGGFGLSTQLLGRTENQELLSCDNNQEKIIITEKGKQKMLSREAISKCFYMPINQAAKELNIGVTLLKIRCRDLGIRRWPHRKLMSLQTLIKNVKTCYPCFDDEYLQELKRGEGNGMEQKWKDVIDSLEEEKKRMEEIPDMELEEKTKKLRQSCFKANHKKRKLMGMAELQASFDTYKCDSGPLTFVQ
ncbi:protein RKD1-like [Lycium ferocissimum]|uniref:protein RKD1-like n=1 Tax=Lycium ferocissimum TaxID=112874 RepID=UPI0028166793|nr:protein RKD1-like [Lycium ferocissimum]